jgi:hypothetical protein
LVKEIRLGGGFRNAGVEMRFQIEKDSIENRGQADSKPDFARVP